MVTLGSEWPRSPWTTLVETPFSQSLAHFLRAHERALPSEEHLLTITLFVLIVLIGLTPSGSVDAEAAGTVPRRGTLDMAWWSIQLVLGRSLREWWLRTCSEFLGEITEAQTLHCRGIEFFHV